MQLQLLLQVSYLFYLSIVRFKYSVTLLSFSVDLENIYNAMVKLFYFFVITGQTSEKSANILIHFVYTYIPEYKSDIKLVVYPNFVLGEKKD